MTVVDSCVNVKSARKLRSAIFIVRASVGFGVERGCGGSINVCEREREREVKA